VNIKAWLFALAVVSGWMAGRSDAGLRFAILLPVMLAYAFASNLRETRIYSLMLPTPGSPQTLWVGRP
jgi:hypothetical protein